MENKKIKKIKKEAPIYLKHKPIIAVNDYDKIDAQYADDTDVCALSIGYAQYNEQEKKKEEEISLKIWRHTGERWSRQSEEMPIHRCLDLNILLLGSLMTAIEEKYPKTSLRETIVDIYKDKVGYIAEYYKNNEQFLKPRLIELKNRLTDFLASQK